MVCVVCLLPLFILPFLQLLPQLWDRIMTFVYGTMGWEYKPPVRELPACPYKPGSRKSAPKTKELSKEGQEASGESKPLVAATSKEE